MSIKIVIPVYKEFLEPSERASLIQCFKILYKYPFALVCSQNLNAKDYLSIANKHSINLNIERFDSNFFLGIKGYNELMLSNQFYKRFITFKNILIYQLDCFIFRDNLQYWIKKNYDFIGAPWLSLPWLADCEKDIKFKILNRQPYFKKFFLRLKWFFNSTIRKKKLNVGNGGFSIRNVQLFYSITLKEDSISWVYNEDIFWSIYVPLTHNFKIPSQKIALSFSFDAKPELAFKLTSEKIPMGCHGWNRNDYPYENNLLFWNRFIYSNPYAHD